jgi:hypothetical protein
MRHYSTSCMVRFDGTTLVMADILFSVSDEDVWQEGQEYVFTLEGTGGHHFLKSLLWNTQWSDCLLPVFDRVWHNEALTEKIKPIRLRWA